MVLKKVHPLIFKLIYGFSHRCDTSVKQENQSQNALSDRTGYAVKRRFLQNCRGLPKNHTHVV